MDTLKVDVINFNNLNGNTFWGVSLDALIPALISAVIAIIVFSLGFYITKKNELKKRYQHYKQIEKYIYVLFEDLEKSVKSRIKSFKSLISQLKEKEFKDFEMEYVSDYSMEFINDIDWLDFFSVFTLLKRKVGNLNVKLYQNINRNIASIRDVNNLWLDSYNELIRRQSSHEIRWNEAIEKIGKLVDSFAHWLRAESYKKGSNPFIDELDNIIGKHQKEKNARDIFVAIDSLINPLHYHISKNQNQRIGRDFLDHVMACKYAYANFTKNRENFAYQFEHYISTLKKSILELKKNVGQLRQMIDDSPKFRYIWKL